MISTWQDAYAGRLVGMTTVEEHAGAWTGIAREFVRGWLEENPTLFPDDLWTAGLPEPPNHRRALGPVLAYAKREGWMERSTDWRQSVSSHLAHKIVWTSLLYDAEFVGDVCPGGREVVLTEERSLSLGGIWALGDNEDDG